MNIFNKKKMLFGEFIFELYFNGEPQLNRETDGSFAGATHFCFFYVVYIVSIFSIQISLNYFLSQWIAESVPY